MKGLLRLLVVLGLVAGLAGVSLAQTTTTTTTTITTTTTLAATVLPTDDGCIQGFTTSGTISVATCLWPVVIVDTRNGVVTLTLPAASTGARVTWAKANSDSNAIHVVPAGSDVIAVGPSTFTETDMSTPGQVNTLVANPAGGKWFFIGTGVVTP